MLAKQDLPGILLGLGTTPAEVAATLKRNNIQGVRNTIRHLNPIVRFVQRRLLIDDYQLYLEQQHPNSHIGLELALPDGSTERVAIGGAVKEFLDGFDRGGYPELELPPVKL